MQGHQERRLWAWDISALLYERAYIRVAHQTDDDLLAYLGTRVSDAVVADCGCGPGVVSEKFLRAGASLVVGLDTNAAMVTKARRRLAKSIANGCSVVRQQSHEGDALVQVSADVLNGRGFDMILFKRSLYMPRARALRTLQSAAAALRVGGAVVVVHPERQLRRYAFALPFGVTSYTLFHLFNRAISRLAEHFGAEEYTLYARDELLALLRDAVPSASIEVVPSLQRPYNLVALWP